MSIQTDNMFKIFNLVVMFPSPIGVMSIQTKRIRSDFRVCVSFRPLSGLCLFRLIDAYNEAVEELEVSVPGRGYVYSDLKNL